MRNLHQIILHEYGLEAWCLFRNWERLWLRESDYKNHRIFTLRCLHKDLVPVSIKLKSTLKAERAKKIVRKVEKDLIQARIKAINSILDNIGKQTELCSFIDKVGEIRFNKVKQRQLNRFQNLVNKKEGNITRVSNNNSLQAGNNLVASRQAGRHSPSLRGRQQHPSGQSSPFPQGRRWSKGLPGRLRLRCSPSLRGRQQFLTPDHCSPSSQGRKQFFPGNCSPSYQGRKQFSPGNCSTSSQGSRQFLPGNCSLSLWGKKQFFPGNCSPSSQGRKQFSPGNCSPSSWGRKWFLLGNCSLSCQERSSSYQATAHLPPGEGSGSS